MKGFWIRLCLDCLFGNVSCHHNKYLIGYIEFLHSLRIICLPLNISEKTTSLWKAWRGKDSSSPSSLLRQYNTHTTWRATSTIYLNKRGPPPFFHSDTNPVLGHFLVHSVGKTHVLVVTVKFIWLLLLNILSSNFVLTPNKFLRFNFNKTEVKSGVLNLQIIVM